MTIAASVALRAAIHDALAADSALVAVLGGPKIYDELPRPLFALAFIIYVWTVVV